MAGALKRNGRKCFTRRNRHAQCDTVSGSRAGEQAHTSTVTTLCRCPVCLTWRRREGLSQVSPTLCPPSPLKFPGWVGDSLRLVRRESGFFIFLTSFGGSHLGGLPLGNTWKCAGCPGDGAEHCGHLAEGVSGMCRTLAVKPGT